MSSIHSRFNAFVSICFSGWLLCFSQGLFASPVAMVTEAQGTLNTDGQPLALLAELNENAQIELADGSQLTLVYYEAGQEYSAQGPLTLTLKKNAPEANGKPLNGTDLLAAADGIKLATAEHSQMAVNMRSVAAQSPSNGLILQYPVWSSVLEPAPIFSWKMANGQDKEYSYRLEVINEKGKVVYTGQSDIGRLRLPKDLELPKGERLTWELEAKKGNDILSSSAEFQIADDATVTRIDQLAKDLGQDFGRRLVFLRYLKTTGFRHAADELWENLVNERPELAAQHSP